MRNKKGSHIDVVISFMIFVIFLGFLYSILSPVKIQRDKESLLDYVEGEIIGKLSSNLTTATIRIANTYDSNCFEIKQVISFDETTMDLLVKNTDNDLVKFELREGNPDLLRIDTGGVFTLKIYYSEEKLDNSPIDEESCPFTPGTFYSEAGTYDDGETPVQSIKKVGLVRTEEYIFEEKVIGILNSQTAYNELKNSLKIPDGEEIGIDFITENGDRIIGEVKEILKDTYVREVPVQYVDSEASIKSGTLIIKLW
ncbi:MAG: hypothetical protein Q8P15_02790 [Nanoarchaeota archaeon]|nr:hypothetical protein [Nanoarchaeota archaeon]